jgi:hypothetical protein
MGRLGQSDTRSWIWVWYHVCTVLCDCRWATFEMIHSVDLINPNCIWSSNQNNRFSQNLFLTQETGIRRKTVYSSTAFIWSRNSSVRNVTVLRTGRPGFDSYQDSTDRIRIPPFLLSSGCCNYFLGGTSADVRLTTQRAPNAEVKNTWSYTFTPPTSAWCSDEMTTGATSSFTVLIFYTF